MRRSPLQAEYSLMVRSAEWELLPVCQEERLAFTAWSPLAGGWLSGKYRRGEAPPQDSRVGRKDRWDDQPEQRESDTTWKVVAALRQVSGRLAKFPAQVALNWLLQKGEDIVPIIDARTAEQLKDNLGASGWRLGGEDMRLLDAASPCPTRTGSSSVTRSAGRRAEARAVCISRGRPEPRTSLARLIP